MEVILLEKIENLGDIGDTVRVRAGFGRNFLIPQGKAKPATAENIAEVEAIRAELERKEAAALTEARDRAAKLEQLASITISQKAGSEGKLFGSVGPQDIADACTEKGVELEKREVLLTEGGTIRTVGEHEVLIRLHTDIELPLRVDVVAEEEEDAES